MRILSLDLESYGPFTGQTLTFPRDAKLHIVYGPNEAGKSCSLAAITDLFFGIDPRTRYDFLHDGKDLRIGATIERQDGSRLTFRRRKGNKNTVLDLAGAPLSDDALRPFLGSLTREVFSHAFGLDTEKLRAGAEEMLKSGGEVGASLFAAASGLRGLTELRRNLETQADRIFAPRAAKDRVFYQALDRFDVARKAIRELELRAGDWKALNERIDELGKKLDQIKQERGTIAAEQARLSRLKRVAPLLRQIDLDLAALGSLGKLPEVPDGFTERLRNGIEALAKAIDARKISLTDHEQANRDLSEITVDEALIAKSGDVQRLFAETGAYANDRRDMPRIQSEEDQHSALLGQLAVRLGVADATRMAAQQPTDAALALTRRLITEGKSLEQAVKGHAQALASETEALAKLEQERTARGALVDPRPMREKLLALAPVLKQLEKLSEEEHALTAETRKLGEAAARLDPAIADLDALAEASVPTPETIARFRQRLDGLAEDIRRADERVAAAAETSATITVKLQELASGRPVPSAEAIAVERNTRDQAWGRMRDSLVGSAEPLTGGPLAEAIVTFERHSAEADRLADSAVSDAERVAAHAAEKRRLGEERRKEAEARDRVGAVEEERRQALEAWRATWAPAGIIPLPPAEMAVWLSSIKHLLERREKRDALKDDIDRIESAIRAIAPALQEIADEIALPKLEGLDTGLLAQRIQDRLSAIAASWDEARDLETSARDAQSRIDKLRVAVGEAERQLGAWATKWQAAVGALRLPPNSAIDEADASLLAWKEVPATIRERDNRARRVAGMRRNVESFESQTAALVEAVARDLVSLPRDLAIKTLAERLTLAKGAEVRRDEAMTRLAAATRSRVTADAALKEAESGLSLLTKALPPEADPNDLLQRLTQRDRLAATLTERRSQIAAQGDGFSEDQLRSEFAAVDVDQADAALKGFAADDEILDQQAQEVFAERDRATRQRSELEQGVGAEVALQQRRNAEAELVNASREWTVLKLGALLIGRVVERHRADQRDPLMARAGMLFSSLTGGAFAGLDQDFRDDDVPRLVGRRKAGELVSVPGLSEGTRDQLYLALRLAYLEDYASRAEAVPFIGDDLFTSFDDDRTANGLATLAALADRVQPILFTHHRHVVEIARKAIGPELAVIELS